MYKTGFFLITLLVGSIAIPINENVDLSSFFEHPVNDPFIIGGTVADPVPHMVALTTGIFTKGFFCGGSIINERLVLTAAHCNRGVTEGTSVLRSLRGNLGSNVWSSSSVAHGFSRAINHPDYNYDLIKNDIGFLVTSSAITFKDNIQPVALNFDFVGPNVATIANGWGVTFNGSPTSSVLMELRPLTVDGQQCVVDVARVVAKLNRTLPHVDPEIELCAFLEINRGMCFGDSGSALILEESKQQVGVVSWGVPCAQGAPDMYVRISAYKSWIETIL